MKARIEAGKIIKYNILPETLNANGKHYLNFRSASHSEIESAGFYDIIVPAYDPITQTIHNLHFDDNFNIGDGIIQSVFIYDVKLKTISETVSQLKTQRIDQLKKLAYDKLQPTDWMAIRKAEKGIEIPSETQTERDNIRATVITKESEINSLTTKESILKFDINF